MPRKPRIHYEGALFHVVCRGNNREWILRTDDEKQRYFDLLRRYKEKCDFNLYAWVIMSNHVHLLIEVKKTPLSKIMQGIQQSYTQWYNKYNSRVGHVFEQRYKAIHCNKGAYLLNLLRYIHQNPVRVNIEEGLYYAWSSNKDYLCENGTGLTDVTFPLSLFSEERDRARTLYLEFMDEEEDFLEKIKVCQLEEGTKEGETALVEKAVCNDSFDEILEKVSLIMGVKKSEIIGNGRRRIISKSRKLVIVFCTHYTHFSQKNISGMLNMTESAVSKALLNELDIVEWLEQLENESSIQA